MGVNKLNSQMKTTRPVLTPYEPYTALENDLFKLWMIRIFLLGVLLNRVKAETQDATNRCDTSPQQVAATNRPVWHAKIIVAATEFGRCDLSHDFKLVWIRATDRRDQIP